MVLKAKTKFYLTRNRLYLYVPMDIVKDSQFPFKAGESIAIEIEGRSIIIKQLEDDEKEQKEIAERMMKRAEKGLYKLPKKWKFNREEVYDRGLPSKQTKRQPPAQTKPK